MKQLEHCYVVSDQERAVLAILKATLGQIHGSAPKIDSKVHALLRIGSVGIVLVPDRGIFAPTSPDGKPPTKRDLPWLPPEVVWVPGGELRRRNTTERGWTQAQLAEVRQLLTEAHAITVVSSSDRTQHAIDELMLELPDSARASKALLPFAATPEQVVRALSHPKKYRASKNGVDARRHCLALDFLASKNFQIGLAEKLREAKVGPAKGLHFTLIMAGVLGAIDRAERFDGQSAMGWREELVVESPDGVLALDRVDPLTSDATYQSIVAARPPIGTWGSIIERTSETLELTPPAPLTIGGLLGAGVDPLEVLSSLRQLSAAGHISHAFEGGRSYPPISKETLARVVAMLPESFERERLSQVLKHELPEQTDATRYAITPLFDEALWEADLGERDHRTYRTVLRRWVQSLAGPVQAQRSRLVILAGGRRYATWIYDVIDNPGWADRLPSVTPEGKWRIGQRVQVLEGRVEPTFPKAIGLGELLDGLSLGWAPTPWESERVPGAVVASPTSILGALTALVDEGVVMVDVDRAHLTPLGHQIIRFMPLELRHPAWVANLRTAAQRATTATLRDLTRADLDTALKDYAGRTASTFVTVSSREWKAEAAASSASAATRSVDREDEVRTRVPEPR